MRVCNINELIGIIKGINFDGIINDKEVAHLQLWVDRNRNLAYGTRQAELISIVDSVLEDHIIDENEKKLLLAKSEFFLIEMGEEVGKIYELNGIIEGIICDGQVNEVEVYRLKMWMDIYGSSIRGHKSNEKLCEVVDDILQDGIVTEDEQEKLLIILSSRIQYFQFETKLDYLCKKVKERKNIGTDLIDILDNELAITEIHRRAESKLINGLSSYSGDCVNREIIVISLVLIAMLEYNGNYYDSVRATYTEAYRKYSEQKVEGYIRSILSRYKKQNDSGSRTRIINVALENAIVPQTFLAAFFEFIFDIYKVNFEYDLSNELYEDFQFVFEGLCNNMLSEGDDVSIIATQKTYKLITTTKQLIVKKEDGLDAIIKLSIIIVKLIDRSFWDKEVKILNPYLKVGYERWKVQLKDTTRGNKSNKLVQSELRSHWKPKYSMEKDMIYLVPPIHRVKAQYDYNKLTVVVLNGDEELCRNNQCSVKEIIGGYQVNLPKIKIENPLGKLTYRFICGDEIIYDSKDKLYRNYIVFDQEGQEIGNNTDFEGTVYLCYKEGETELQNICTKEFYCVGYKLVRHGDAIGVGHDVFNFSSMVKPGIFGDLYKHCFVSDFDNESIPVYKKVNVVVFEAKSTFLKYEILINNKPYKLSEMSYKTTENKSITKYVVDLDLEECGFYTVEINQIIFGKKNRILRENLIYDNSLYFSSEKLENGQYNITVNSSILEQKIDIKISINDFELDFIRFFYEGHEYNYLLPFDFGCYRINNGNWNIAQSDLWIEDISLESTMFLFDSECDNLLIYNENDKLVESNIIVQDNGFYKKIDIGFLNSYKYSNQYIKLIFTVDGKKKYTMFCYNKCVIREDETEIIFSENPKKAIVKPVFHGKNRVYFEVYNKNGEKVYSSKALRSGQTETLYEVNSFENYTFNFYEQLNGLMLKNKYVLYQKNTMFYAKQDFIGRVFKIKTAYFNQFIRGKYIEKEYYFNKAYVRITKLMDENLFEGQIFVSTVTGEWILDGINPVEVEICSEIIDDTMDVYMTNQGDGLLLDFEKHGILNSLEHHKAPDIFLYTLSMNGGIYDEKVKSNRAFKIY